MSSHSYVLQHLTLNYSFENDDLVEDFLNTLYRNPSSKNRLGYEKREYFDPPFHIEHKIKHQQVRTRKFLRKNKVEKREKPADVYLDFRSVGATSLEVGGFVGKKTIKDAKTLIMMDLSGNEITSMYFLRENYFPNLKHLYISENYLTSLTHLPSKLESVVCQRNKIDDFGIVRVLKNMKTIDLSKNNIKDFRNFPFFEKIEEIKLKDNPITQLKHYAEIISFLAGPSLRILDGEDISNKYNDDNEVKIKNTLRLQFPNAWEANRLKHSFRIGFLPEKLFNIIPQSKAYTLSRQNKDISNSEFLVKKFQVDKTKTGKIKLSFIISIDLHNILTSTTTNFENEEMKLGLCNGVQLRKFSITLEDVTVNCYLHINGYKIKMNLDSSLMNTFYVYLLLTEGNYDYYYEFDNGEKSEEVMKMNIKTLFGKKTKKKPTYTTNEGVEKDIANIEIVWSTIDGSRVTIRQMDTIEYMISLDDFGKTLKASLNFQQKPTPNFEKGDGKDVDRRMLFQKDLIDVCYIPSHAWKYGFIIEKQPIDYTDELLIEKFLKVFYHSILPLIDNKFGYIQEKSKEDDNTIEVEIGKVTKRKKRILSDVFGSNDKITAVIDELYRSTNLKSRYVLTNSQRKKELDDGYTQLRKIILTVYTRFNTFLPKMSEYHLLKLQKLLNFKQLRELIQINKFQLLLNFMIAKWNSGELAKKYIIVLDQMNILRDECYGKFSQVMKYLDVVEGDVEFVEESLEFAEKKSIIDENEISNIIKSVDYVEKTNKVLDVVEIPQTEEIPEKENDSESVDPPINKIIKPEEVKEEVKEEEKKEEKKEVKEEEEVEKEEKKEELEKSIDSIIVATDIIAESDMINFSNSYQEVEPEQQQKQQQQNIHFNVIKQENIPEKKQEEDVKPKKEEEEEETIDVVNVNDDGKGEEREGKVAPQEPTLTNLHSDEKKEEEETPKSESKDELEGELLTSTERSEEKTPTNSNSTREEGGGEEGVQEEGEEEGSPDTTSSSLTDEDDINIQDESPPKSIEEKKRKLSSAAANVPKLPLESISKMKDDFVMKQEASAFDYIDSGDGDIEEGEIDFHITEQNFEELEKMMMDGDDDLVEMDIDNLRLSPINKYGETTLDVIRKAQQQRIEAEERDYQAFLEDKKKREEECEKNIDMDIEINLSDFENELSELGEFEDVEIEEYEFL